jgi:hypothetical protein
MQLTVICRSENINHRVQLRLDSIDHDDFDPIIILEKYSR